MIENLKRRLAHFILSKKFLKKNNEQINFNKIITNSQNFFVIVPLDDKDLNNSLDLIKYLLIHKKNITIFIPEHKYNFFPGKDKFNFITYQAKHITRLNLPIKSLINHLHGKTFDVVIDLNRNENVFFSAVANIVNARVRIGFLKELSESYYNLLFNDLQREAELSYRNFLNFLRMF